MMASLHVRRRDTAYGRIMPANSFAAICPCALIACTAAACCASQLPAIRPYRMYSRSLLRLSAACNPRQQFCHHAVQYRRCWQLHRITTAHR